MQTTVLNAADQSQGDASLLRVDDASGFDSTLTLDRRRSERMTTSMVGWVSGESNDRSARGRDVMVSDLSMDGIGFRDAGTSYRVGACHWVVVSGGAMRISTRIKIVSCRPNAAGGFDVGARFF